MLYYTPEVQANVADLDGFFDQVLAETNQGDFLFGVYLQNHHTLFRIPTERHPCPSDKVLY